MQHSKEVKENPEIIKNAPYNTVVKRVDKSRDVKTLILTYNS